MASPTCISRILGVSLALGALLVAAQLVLGPRTGALGSIVEQTTRLTSCPSSAV